jgi:hypothetical protein
MPDIVPLGDPGKTYQDRILEKALQLMALEGSIMTEPLPDETGRVESDSEFIEEFTPAGDAKELFYRGPKAIAEGDILGAALAGLSALPLVPALGGIKKMTPDPWGHMRQLRGPVEGGGESIADLLRRVDKTSPISINPAYDEVASLEEAINRAADIDYLDPIVVPEGKARYSPLTVLQESRGKGERGTLGNVKMARSNPSYPEGRQTLDIPGCGRSAFCNKAGLPAEPCYGGKCYAHAQGIAKGKGVIENHGNFLQQSDSTVKDIYKQVKKTGLEQTKATYPEYTIKYYEDTDKVTVKPKSVPDPARVPAEIKKNLKNVTGKDLRLGVDTDGGAFLSKPEVMDDILAKKPKTVTVFSSGYHTPPPPHPLAGRTMINVTVSGWHPMPETIKRLEWAKQARENGWNVVLREVTADPKTFTEGVDLERYNRMRDVIHNTDFYVMEQPLHTSQKYGKALDYPACCSSGNCSNCRVADGTGKAFEDFWQRGRDAPLFEAHPDWEAARDRRDQELIKLGGLTSAK